MKDLPDIIKDLDDEILRSKLFVNENGYHNGTAINEVVRRYRKELKQLRKIILDDFREDNINNYRDVEN